jgi:hypothetical protein
MKIKKRDILFFTLGIVTWFIVNIFWNWEENVNGFKQGFKAGMEAVDYSE